MITTFDFIAKAYPSNVQEAEKFVRAFQAKLDAVSNMTVLETQSSALVNSRRDLWRTVQFARKLLSSRHLMTRRRGRVRATAAPSLFRDACCGRPSQLYLRRSTWSIRPNPRNQCQVISTACFLSNGALRWPNGYDVLLLNTSSPV